MGVNENQIKGLIKDVCVQLGEKYAKEEGLDIVYANWNCGKQVPVH